MDKLISALITLFLLPVYSFAQSIPLSGQVSMHNSQTKTGTIQYIENAEVSAAYAASRATDVEGKFELIFSGAKKGTLVALSVSKPDLEVVNERDLKNVILGRKAYLKVYLAPKGELAQAQTELYAISLKAVTAKHDALIVELRKGGEEAKEAMARLEAQLNREIEHRFEAEDILREQLDAIKKRLPETTKALAQVNLDFASDLYKEAYGLFQKGEVDVAIKKLNETELEEKAQQSIANIENIDKDTEEFLLAKEVEENRVQQIVESYKLKSDLFMLQFKYLNALHVDKKVIRLMEKTKDKADGELSDAYRKTID